MRITIATVIASVLWLCTFLLVIPDAVQLPKAMSVAGLVLAVFSPVSWLDRAEFNFVVNYSYWIGLAVMLTASGLVVLANGRSKRTARIVAILDLIMIALSIVVGTFVATTPTPLR